MNQRTMVKISAEKEVITLQTFSREYRSSQRFFVLRSKLEELNAKGKVIVDDIHSFAIPVSYTHLQKRCRNRILYLL